MSDIPYKTYLSEDEVPSSWYNVRADMAVKPAPLVNPATGRPCTADDLRPVFCDELIKQELDNDTPYIEMPGEIRDFYRMFRPSPLIRAYSLAGPEGRDDRDRRGAVGHGAFDGLRVLRPRLQGVHGEVLVRAEAVPPRGDAHIRRERDAIAVHDDERRPPHQQRASWNDRLPRLRHIRGG